MGKRSRGYASTATSIPRVFTAQQSIKRIRKMDNGRGILEYFSARTNPGLSNMTLMNLRGPYR
jgi:hypothetical protein